jgi:glyoxylase-like metal-dependent hydrolase (beta-lactamase superfamily II)
MAALRQEFDLSVAEGWQSYRRLRDALTHQPGLVDLDRHPRILAREVRAARLDLVRAEGRELERELRLREMPPRALAEVEEIGEVEEVGEIEYEEFEMTATTKGHTPRSE